MDEISLLHKVITHIYISIRVFWRYSYTSKYKHKKILKLFKSACLVPRVRSVVYKVKQL